MPVTQIASRSVWTSSLLRWVNTCILCNLRALFCVILATEQRCCCRIKRTGDRNLITAACGGENTVSGEFHKIVVN
ncbi:hypothetical protein KCP76_03210 [Salmonella enterica subsp. enterica serovar Weltevreden]|nr:hypothetical protein KCP76_03210 [Salmonella enterica subsp. enterica serovar Weltevreden]